MQSEPSVYPRSRSVRLFSDVDDGEDDFRRSRISTLLEENFEECDVSSKSSLKRTKGKISKLELFHTYPSPECRVPSRIHNLSHHERLDNNIWTDIDLTDNILELLMHMHREALYELIKISKREIRFRKLEKTLQLGQLASWINVDVNGCMLKIKRPVTQLGK